jgi:hypothetical protein
MVLIIGVTTSMAAIGRVLPSITTLQLSGHTFYMTASDVVLDELIHTLFVKGALPFCLGPETCRFLIEQFDNANWSIASFAKKLRVWN